MRLTFSRPTLSQVLPVLFFFLAALPAGAVGILLTKRAWQREFQTAQEQHLQLAQNIAAALGRYAEDVEAVFQLAIRNLIMSQPAQDLTPLLHRLHFKHICIVNSAGQIEKWVASHATFTATSLPAPWVVQMRTAGPGSVLPDPQGVPTVFLWQPLGADRYALGALTTDYFVALQEAIRFGEHGHAAIVDRHGRIIAHLPWSETLAHVGIEIDRQHGTCTSVATSF